MCRYAAAIGPPTSAAELLYVPAHGLQHQAWAPREQQHGHVNVDGTGIAWWPEAARTPRRYASTSTPWADTNLSGLADLFVGSPILAAVRGATPGVGHGVERVAPFVHEGVAFAHNGWLSNWRGDVGRELMGQVGAAGWRVQPGVCDSRLLFALVVDALDVGHSLLDAVEHVIRDVAKHVAASDDTATMNLLVATADEIVATRASVGFAGNSLHVDAGRDGAMRVASEPLDDAEWHPVPDATAIHVHDQQLDMHVLDIPELTRD